MVMPGFCFCMWEFFQWSQNITSSGGGPVYDSWFPHSGFGPGGVF